MSSSKKQQSFSSYSEEKNYTRKVEVEEDGFSEYEEQTIPKQRSQVHKQIVQRDIPQQRRRYSYGKIDEKSTAYNYLDGFNDIPNTRATYYTASLKHPRQSKFLMGTGSPCGVGAFDSTSLLEYEQCYLSGLNKYYKSHNYNKEPQRRISVSSSIDKNKSIQKSSLDRSQYWNGQKFDYFKDKQPQIIEKQPQINQNQRLIKQKKPQIIEKREKSYLMDETKNNKKAQFQRNLTSGLIVNKKQLKQTKTTKPTKTKPDTSTYIKIQQHPSNTKNYSQAKKPSIQKTHQNKIKEREALIQRQLKQNTTVPQKIKQTDSKFQFIEVRPKQSILMEKQYSILLAQKNQLALQNSRLKEILKNKDLQIQSLSKQRIIDNDDYVQKIEKLKKLFESQRNEIIRQYESQINVYKSVRKEALKNQMIKQQGQKITLINEKNKLEIQLKKVNIQINNLQQDLNQKNKKIKYFEQQVSSLQSQIDFNNENRIQPIKVSIQKQKQNTKNQINKQQSPKIQQSIPQWMSNFLTVFKNMVIKLLGDVDPSWSQKKIIIIGWKIVKIIIQKAVKIGIKVPEIINNEQSAQCSLILHPQRSSEDAKKYNFNASKKPIRV